MVRSKELDKKISLNNFFYKYFLLIAIALISIFFGLKEPAFFQIENLLDIVRSGSIIGLMSIGLTFTLIAGEFDFSVGAMATFTVCLAGKMLALPSFKSIFLVIIISLMISCTIGLLNAFNTLVIGVPAFIATLGLSILLGGIVKYMTGGGVLYSLSWPKTFFYMGQGKVFNIIPVPVAIMLFAATFSWIYTEQTKIGRYLYAVGANPETALHVGINTKKIKTISFILSSFFAGSAGIILGSTLGSITPGMGEGNLTSAIGAAMLGATFFKPGTLNMIGTVVASLLLAVITNGLTMIGATYYMKEIIQGTILLISVGIIASIKHGKLPSVNLTK